MFYFVFFLGESGFDVELVVFFKLILFLFFFII